MRFMRLMLTLPVCVAALTYLQMPTKMHSKLFVPTIFPWTDRCTISPVANRTVLFWCSALLWLAFDNNRPFSHGGHLPVTSHSRVGISDAAPLWFRLHFMWMYRIWQTFIQLPVWSSTVKYDGQWKSGRIFTLILVTVTDSLHVPIL